MELHEAFAGQVLANLKALDSEKFCQEKLGLKEKVPKSWGSVVTSVIFKGFPMESLQPAMCCLTLISGGGGSHGEAEHVGWLCVHWASLRRHWWVGLRVGIIEYVHNGRYEQPFLQVSGF